MHRRVQSKTIRPVDVLQWLGVFTLTTFILTCFGYLLVHVWLWATRLA